MLRVEPFVPGNNYVYHALGFVGFEGHTQLQPRARFEHDTSPVDCIEGTSVVLVCLVQSFSLLLKLVKSSL